MNTFKKIVLIFFLGLPTITILGTQPETGKQKESSPATIALMNRLKKENRDLKRLEQLLSETIGTPFTEITQTKVIKIPGFRVTVMPQTTQQPTTQIEELTPMDELEESLKTYKASVDNNVGDVDLRREEVMQLIKKYRSKIPTMRNSKKQTPLMLCAKYGCSNAIVELFSMKVNLDDRDAENRTALTYCFDPYYPTFVLKFCSQMKEKHQTALVDALNYAGASEIVDAIWNYLDIKTKADFAAKCDPNDKKYQNIRKSFSALKKHANEKLAKSNTAAAVVHPISNAPTTAASITAAALTPEEKAKSEAKKAAQKRRKEAKKLKAQEEAEKEALKLKAKQEEEENALKLAVERKKEKEKEAALRAMALKFEKDHAAPRLKKAIHRLKINRASHKKDEKRAVRFAQSHEPNHIMQLQAKAFRTWKEGVKNHGKMQEKADALARKKFFHQWLLKTKQLKASQDEELNLRLKACANAFELHHIIKSQKSKYTSQIDRAVDQLVLGRAEINLLLSAQRIVQFYVEQKYTDISFLSSRKPRDLQAKKQLLAINESLPDTYLLGTNTQMITQFFKNAWFAKKTKEEEEANQLFDAVRARDDKRLQLLQSPALRNSEHANMNNFRHWLAKKSSEPTGIPSNAMVEGDGIRDIMNMAYVSIRGKAFNNERPGTVLESMPSPSNRSKTDSERVPLSYAQRLTAAKSSILTSTTGRTKQQSHATLRRTNAGTGNFNPLS